VAPADWRKKKTNIINSLIKLASMSLIQILGLAAGTITSITFLPQVIHIWKTKSAKDLSLMMLLLLILGVLLWLTYGLLVMDAAIIYTNSMVLAMSLILLYFKLRFK
jgi:MtN3 and saliva related transmembrane protein